MTKHIFMNIDSKNTHNFLEKDSVDLIVTSPPYPMISMWDNLFQIEDCKIKSDIDVKNAFEKSTNFLNDIWFSTMQCLKSGGIFCINIGDATRSFNEKFQLFNNHQKIIDFFIKNGFSQLPSIIWRKQSNSPNKFMGSGVLPVGAYVTLEHEWILIFRKNNEKRGFLKESDKFLRRESAFFWEERNIWFSDVWDFKGTSQKINIENTRKRSASFPLELPHRLINMFSVKGDTILDPFLGLGTTTLAAIMNNRNSIGIEIDKNILDDNLKRWSDNIGDIKIDLNKTIQKRIEKHKKFVKDNELNGKFFKYFNKNLNEKIKTRQELDLKINNISEIYFNENNEIIVEYN